MPSRPLKDQYSKKSSDCKNENDASTIEELLADLDKSDLVDGREDISDEVLDALDRPRGAKP